MKPVILTDENIPWLEHYLGGCATIRKSGGRDIGPAQLRDVDALLVRSVTRVDEQLLRDSPVRFVGSATSGVDHIDRRYLQQQKIHFCYAPGSNANSVVEYVLAAIAAVDDKLERLMAGGRVGIIGYGVIGKRMGQRLQDLGIDYCAYDPWLDADKLSHAAPLEAILDCDVISLHAELTREQPWPSFHLLGTDELCALRADALLINASRGAVVDNAALLALMEQGKFGAQVILDVWEGEPCISEPLLRRVALASPHIAGYSLDGKILATRMLCESLAEYFQLPALNSDSPVADAAPAALVAAVNGAALVRCLLQQCYDIGVDDALLREATLGASPARAAVAFDQLRKTYRERRELYGTRVCGQLTDTRDLQLLKALGCSLDSNGSST